MGRKIALTGTEAARRLVVVEQAAHDLRMIRAALREVSAHAAADYVQRALKSVEGAVRHANGLLIRAGGPADESEPD